MKHLSIIILISLISLKSNSQATNSWQLFLNSQKISVGVLGKPTTVQLSSKNLGYLKLKIFSDTSRISFRKTIVIMDTLGRQIFKEEFQVANVVFKLNENYFIKKWGKIPFLIYCIQIPNNSDLGIRIKPITQVVCAIKWVD